MGPVTMRDVWLFDFLLFEFIIFISKIVDLSTFICMNYDASPLWAIILNCIFLLLQISCMIGWSVAGIKLNIQLFSSAMFYAWSILAAGIGLISNFRLY